MDQTSRDKGRALDVLIVGPYPPPFGGVSAHVERQSRMLEEQGLRVGILNHFGHMGDDSRVVGALHRNPVRYWLALRRWTAPVVHYHHSRFSTLIATALTRRRQRESAYLATIHGRRIERHLAAPLAGRLTRWALGRFDDVIAVSSEIARSLETHLDRRPIPVVPAYLPREAASVAPDHVREFLDIGRTLVVAAYRVVPRGDTGDDYGLDVAVSCFCRLASSQPGLTLAIFLAHSPRGVRAKRYLKALLREPERQGISDRVAVYVGLDLGAVWDHDIVYLRPSRTDGDAVSVREALGAGRPVIASDAVTRPEGVKLVHGHDVAEWCDAIDGVADVSTGFAHSKPDESLRAILALYARHLPARVPVHERASA